MRGRFDFDHQRERAAPDRGQELLARLNGALRPAMLLRFESVHVDGQFSRGDHVGKENEFPAGELGAVTQVKIFGQRVVLPATSFIDARPTPETGGAVKVEK